MSGEVDRHERGPRWPERGEWVRLWPLPVEVPEWAGFSIVMVVLVALLIVSLVAF